LETNVAVTRAAELIVVQAAPLPAERVELRAALRRILREAAHADDDSPRFDCSAVDGYALRRADAAEALKLVGEIQPGITDLPHIGAGECARIFTGAEVPRGADYVAMQEDVTGESGAIRVASLSSETNIRQKGENCRRGDIVASTGRALGPAELSALASCGVTQPLVTRRPRVVHFVTGNELIDPAQSPTGTQLRDSNSILVASFLEARRAELIRHEWLPDSLDAAKAVIESLGHDFDLLLVSGGASVGDYDFAVPMLEHAGFQMQFENVNLRPGKPLKFFARGSTLAFALPGNPVSHWVILHLFIARLLAAWSGANPAETQLRGRLEADFAQKPNRRETYLPAIATPRGAEWRIQPLRFTSSGDIGSVVGANALLPIPAGCAGFCAADPVTFILCNE
jgi:molybdopterin molybdotransferase